MRARLERLAAFLRERGYEAEVVEEEGALYLCQRRCPKLALSKEHEALCESELLAYEEALGLPLAREERIAEGEVLPLPGEAGILRRVGLPA